MTGCVRTTGCSATGYRSRILRISPSGSGMSSNVVYVTFVKSCSAVRPSSISRIAGDIDSNTSYMFTQHVSPPYSGSSTARSTVPIGGHSMNGPSVCHESVRDPRAAAPSANVSLCISGTSAFAAGASTNGSSSPNCAAKSRCCSSVMS